MSDNKLFSNKIYPENSSSLYSFIQYSIHNLNIKTQFGKISNRNIIYCTGKDLYIFFLSNFKVISKILKEKNNITLENNEPKSMQIFYEILFSEKIIFYIEKIPNEKSGHLQYFSPLKNNDDINKILIFDPNNYYAFMIKSDVRMQTFFILLGMILGIIGIVFISYYIGLYFKKK